MDQIKIGKFLQELRKEKGFTQEQLAEQLGVARRTISRWETGNNLPDMDILIELSDLYTVDLRELLDGERKPKKMDKELEETVLKVAEYSNDSKKRLTKTVCVYFILGIAALIANVLLDFFELGDTFWIGFIKGGTFGIALGTMILGLLYATGVMEKVNAFKMRLLKKEIKE